MASLIRLSIAVHLDLYIYIYLEIIEKGISNTTTYLRVLLYTNTYYVLTYLYMQVHKYASAPLQRIVSYADFMQAGRVDGTNCHAASSITRPVWRASRLGMYGSIAG